MTKGILFWTLIAIILLGSLDFSFATEPGGGILPPLITCRDTEDYDVYIDIGDGVGAVYATKDEPDAQAVVPVKMYATRHSTGDGLTITKFNNTIYYDNTELHLIDVVGVNWPDQYMDWDSTTAGGNQTKIEVGGFDQSLEMPDEDWLVVYELVFRVWCADEDQIDLSVTIDETDCDYNNVNIYPSNRDEEYDDDWETPGDPDTESDGYVTIMEYATEASIEVETVYFGYDLQDTVTVYAEQVNYRFDEVELFLKFDDDLFDVADFQLEWLAACMTSRVFEVEGDSIYVHLYNEPYYTMDEIDQERPIFNIIFELDDPAGQDVEDDQLSMVMFNTAAPNCFKPAGCSDLCGSITETWANGALNIPEYRVDAYLEFDDDYREPGGFAYLDLYLLNTFPAGIINHGNLQFMIGYDSRLIFDSIWSHHPDVKVAASKINGYDSLSITLLDDSEYQGWLEPTDEYYHYCRLEFTIDENASFDCPDYVSAWFEDFYTVNYQTEVVDTSGSIATTIGDGFYGVDDDFTPWCVKLYLTDVSGGSNVWQQLYMYHDMEIDSVNLNVNWDDDKFCLLNNTYWVPGITTSDIENPNGKWAHGDDLNLAADDNTLVADLHFGALETGDVTGTTGFWNPFQDFLHVVDDNGKTWIPVFESGTVTTHLEVWQGSLCPIGPPPQKLTGDGTVPMRFSLHQNYPNPFNPSTSITFDVGNFSWVTIDIFNVLGQRVTTLVDGPMDAGSYEVEWNPGSDSPSGVYFYTIDAGKFTDTKKMMLVK